MKTVVLEPAPAEIDALIARRKALGQDRFDEVWDGVYHMTPGPSGPHAYLDHEVALILGPLAKAAGLIGTSTFNLGRDGDFRIPDQGYHRQLPTGAWVPTAALVVEILSPHDETYEKLGFYAAQGVDEVLVVDPARQRVELLARRGESYEPVEASRVLAVTARGLTERIAWP
jgi:Uma2 family endonuclease